MNLFTLAQNLAPQQTLSELAGFFAKSQNPYVKKAFVHAFAKAYDIDLSEYERGNLDDYESFNDFFTRELKDGMRPLDDTADGIASPADGQISQIGTITNGQLLQAKGRDYDVGQLLADFELGKAFMDGSFATIYLAPTNYHRVHMPFDGTLIATRYVPGTLFSVNDITAKNVPDLFARNERLVCEFDTTFGRACVVLVGAMIVAGIESVATGAIKRTPYIQHRTHDIALKKGDELGRFYLGSTAIIVLPKTANTAWGDEFVHGKAVVMGQRIGRLTKS
ncbi:archaetidylserine decarboxylase [Moraxella nonliquefaciens]|jgi:phosphatidylserine decarboxylase|uniref:Phosphatidylserine decarboxylase proenzyme n=1 Tax=Moraxella nonliquefaciens TaxID=478 RepID=A0A1B8PHR3_MORNO|nr:archaetidylserine decarboxylase [Moraxella nonliquefaciens]MCG7412484.1 archaetidylserine decarboxylase [Moraxella nonliquefaciens]MDI4497767.1 phosphatidylserine decarboxylase [Moraxella nonliquefaciens]MDI4500887.1 phosphatidylserine decarboxylase [Moraxella nonliquefaciens]OBX48751.1 phosphatidylserine decarboxylase [Moraxella nonliquefaciens]OBX49582.1 phosphatidylserine decarboxylase [Moraxella nonliquefaciens]